MSVEREAKRQTETRAASQAESRGETQAMVETASEWVGLPEFLLPFIKYQKIRDLGQKTTFSLQYFEVIGEAVKKLPKEKRLKYLDVEWRRITGLRDILIYDYFRIDIDIVWDVVQTKLPILVKQVQQILSEG